MQSDNIALSFKSNQSEDRFATLLGGTLSGGRGTVVLPFLWKPQGRALHAIGWTGEVTAALRSHMWPYSCALLKCQKPVPGPVFDLERASRDSLGDWLFYECLTHNIPDLVGGNFGITNETGRAVPQMPLELMYVPLTYPEHDTVLDIQSLDVSCS